jgi:OmcA/MtrC family decaheme c-type cytochrome
VVFRLPDGDFTGPGLVLAGPTTDYRHHWTDWKKERAERSGGEWRWQLTTPLPADAKGTYAIGIMGMQGEKPVESRVLYFPVDGSPLRPRRQVVSLEQCNHCHGAVRSGPCYNSVEACLLCHYPSATDERQRPEAERPGESADFRVMIHRIHTGAALQRDYTLYQNGKPHRYTAVKYPANRRNCGECHTGGSERLPLRPERLAVAAPRSPINPMPPATAACLGCHDGEKAATHAAANIRKGVETCHRCHQRHK